MIDAIGANGPNIPTSTYEIQVLVFNKEVNYIEKLLKGHSNEWTKNKLSEEDKGRKATKIVLIPLFWNHVVFTLKVVAPLVHVLHLLYGERKAAMSYIYEAMEKAKETIKKSLSNN